MTPVTFLGKRYYIVHNNNDPGEGDDCTGCEFKNVNYNECPNGYLGSPLRNECNDDNRIYIKRTKKALAEWVAWRLDGFPKPEGDEP